MAGRNRSGNVKGEAGRRAKRRLAKVHGPRCFYCPTTFDDPATATLDHFLPWSLCRRNAGNLVLACEPCNFAKADRLPWPLVWLLLTHHRAPLALAA